MSSKTIMLQAVFLLTIVTLVGGCAPSDQFWKRPDIGDRITTVEDALKRPEAVRNLDLFNRNLPAFPQEILTLSNLERLSLRRNALGDLPATIARLPHLKWLDLGESKLTNAPSALSELPDLSVLYLNDNQLPALPVSLGGLTKLYYLNADRNQLTAIPAPLGKMSTLKWLRLNDNRIPALPNDLSGLAMGLQRLYLRGNPIPDAEKERIRKALPNCQVIF